MTFPRRGVRPPQAPADYVERDCANPTCDWTTWIPPGAEEAAKEAGTPFMPVHSPECAAEIAEALAKVGETAALIDGNTPSLGYRIDRMFAFVAVDDEGEGIIAAPLGGHGTMPLVGADMERMNSLRPIAQGMARMSGRTVRLIRFDNRHVIEEFPA